MVLGEVARRGLNAERLRSVGIERMQEKKASTSPKQKNSPLEMQVRPVSKTADAESSMSRNEGRIVVLSIGKGEDVMRVRMLLSMDGIRVS